MSKSYTLDTNIIINNPNSLIELSDNGENEICIPNHVLEELDKLKTRSDVGPMASYALKLIDENLDSFCIFYNSESESSLTQNFDNSILKEIKAESDNRGSSFTNITISNDRLFRIRAKLFHNLCVEEYHDSVPFQSESQLYTGISTNDNPIFNSFTWCDGKPVFHGIDGPKIINYEHNVWSLKPKNVYQNLAFELLLNEKLDLVTIQSKAGFGKSTLALAAAFKIAFEQKTNSINKIFITKTDDELGDMGYLPGDLDEKFAPSVRPIIDLINKLHSRRNVSKLFEKDNPTKMRKSKIELLPLSYIQGMNIENSILIIDEGQNLTRKTMRAILTRCAENTRVFIIGDTEQVLNPYTNEKDNGLNWIVKLCKGESNYGHIVLTGKKSRGPVTDLILKVGL